VHKISWELYNPLLHLRSHRDRLKQFLYLAEERRSIWTFKSWIGIS
jgi:hypothetical protein